MPDHTRFRAVTEVGDSLLSDQLESNLLNFFNWAMLGVGGFFNVSIPSSGAFGGDQHRLAQATDPYYEPGQLWQGFRQEWVWETGVDYPVQPIHVSGVYVNGHFHPTASTTGAYAHHVNYPLGRVEFDSPIAASSVVTCEFSYRYAPFTTSNVMWFRDIQRDSFRVDAAHFRQVGSGVWSTMGQTRLQLPAVVIEVLPRTNRVGFGVGTNEATVKQDVLFHVIAETPSDRNKLHDIVTTQWSKRIIMYDVNWVHEAAAYPLDENGSPASGALMYPDMVRATGDGGYGWRQLRFVDFVSHPQPPQTTSPLCVASVRGTFEVDWF